MKYLLLITLLLPVLTQCSERGFAKPQDGWTSWAMQGLGFWGAPTGTQASTTTEEPGLAPIEEEVIAEAEESDGEPLAPKEAEAMEDPTTFTSLEDAATTFLGTRAFKTNKLRRLLANPFVTDRLTGCLSKSAEITELSRLLNSDPTFARSFFRQVKVSARKKGRK
ncbi:hypothetical protein HN446_04640 [bacterium]|jgi:hypothetical protein|nr:hypothetical protein [bacterium]